MRIVEFLQSLSTKSFKLASKRQSGMVVFMLSTPTTQQLKDAREHLRYWPYVKAFRPVDKTHMEVLVFVGRGIPEAKWHYYVIQSCILMNQCVRQHQGTFVITDVKSDRCFHKYHENEYLRPDDLLKPFCNFIDEMNFYPWNVIMLEK